MLQNTDFIGIFRNRPMIPDCIHDDSLDFYFYNRNGVININVRDGNDTKILFEGRNFEVRSFDNNDRFEIDILDLDDNNPYKPLRGKMYMRVPIPISFKIFLNDYGWRYFEKID